jgi:5'-3' exoribonuclease 2
MGILRFFRYLSKKYPEIVNAYNNPYFKNKQTFKVETNYKIKNTFEPKCDVVLIDLNAFIHPACQKVFDYGQGEENKSHFWSAKKKEMTMDELERMAFNMICNKIDELIRISNAKKCVYIAIDGVPGMCKQAQQRQRRFKSSKTVKELCVEEKVNPYGFDPNCITTGTEFMDRLCKHIFSYIRKKKTNDWRHLKIVYNDMNVPGEGEHKLIRYLEKNTYYKNITVVSPDADLIMLCMTLKREMIHILRENVFKDYYGDYLFVDVNCLKKCILGEIRCENIEHPFDEEKIIRDFVFYSFMIGNDFLPNVHSLEISNKGIETLISTYAEIYMNYGYIVKDLAKHIYIRKSSFIGLFEELSKLEIRMLLDKYEKGYAKFPDRLLAKHIVRDEGKETNINFVEFRKEYYHKKFGLKMPETLDEEKSFELYVQEICEEYIKGLFFVLKYYFVTIPTFSWYYPHHYAPFFSDLERAIKNKKDDTGYDYFHIEFKPVPPLNMYESLVGILPPRSFYLLPDNVREVINKKIILDADFVEEFEVDLEGKINEYEAICLLPFVSYDKLKRMAKKVEYTEEQKSKIEIGNVYEF